MILFYKNGTTLKIFNPTAVTKYYQLPSVDAVLATEEDLTKVTTVSSAIKQPTILTPVDGSTGFNGDITFSGFETVDTFTGVIDAISIAIATDIDFNNTVVLQKVPTTDTSGINIAVDLSSSDLYIKVKYHSGLYSSIWSLPIKTTTPEYIINKPTIIGPTNGQTGVALFPMISGSIFGYIGVNEVHESTTYQIATDVAFSNIVYNVTSTTDLTSHLITEDLDYKNTYYARIRYTGTKYGNSDWSGVITFTTLAVKNTFLDISGSMSIRMHNVQPIDHKDISAIGYGWRLHPYYVKVDINNRIVKEYEEVGIAGGAMYDSILDSSGNIIFVGHGVNTITNTNVMRILKISPEMVVLKEMNLTGILAIGLRIKRDSLGNYIVVGTSHANNTIVILKLDSNLNILVAKTIVGPNTNGAFISGCFEFDSSNNVIFFGYSATASSEGTIILKYDSNLNKISSRVLNYNGNTTLALSGGIAFVTKDDNGNFYTIGKTQQWDNTSNSVAIIHKFDANLNLIKARDIPNNSLPASLSCIIYHNGNLFVIGLGSYVLKLDINLNLLKTIKFTRNNNTSNTLANDLFKMKADKDGNLYIGGYISSIGGATGSTAGASIVVLERDNLISDGVTAYSLYNISTTPLVLRDVGMIMANITTVEGNLSTASIVTNTAFTAVTSTILSMDI